LEAFFRGDWLTPPPRWKMALATWLGVFPTVVVWQSVFSMVLPNLEGYWYTAILNVFVVASLTWLVMPVVTGALASWLHSASRDD
jgi:antibiotic biosynthesis monooxygenase (ABM) superfamily enzyme